MLKKTPAANVEPDTDRVHTYDELQKSLDNMLMNKAWSDMSQKEKERSRAERQAAKLKPDGMLDWVSLASASRFNFFPVCCSGSSPPSPPLSSPQRIFIRRS